MWQTKGLILFVVVFLWFQVVIHIGNGFVFIVLVVFAVFVCDWFRVVLFFGLSMPVLCLNVVFRFVLMSVQVGEDRDAVKICFGVARKTITGA